MAVSKQLLGGYYWQAVLKHRTCGVYKQLANYNQIVLLFSFFLRALGLERTRQENAHEKDEPAPQTKLAKTRGNIWTVWARPAGCIKKCHKTIIRFVTEILLKVRLLNHFKP